MRHARQPISLTLLAVALATSAHLAAEDATAVLVDNAVARAAVQVTATIADLEARFADPATPEDEAALKYPQFTENKLFGDKAGMVDGTWYASSPTGWSAGLWPAQLWSLHRLGATPPAGTTWAAAAKRWAEGVRGWAVASGNNDITSNNYFAFAPWYEIATGTERETQLATLLAGADGFLTTWSVATPTGRWNATQQCWGYERQPQFDIALTPFNERSGTYWHAFIDQCPNVQQLAWAAEHTTDPAQAAAYRATILAHLRTLTATMADRNGGSWQRGYFDHGITTPVKPLRDDPIRPTGWAFAQHKQGWLGTTTWSRGQAWWLVGLGTGFVATGATDILDTFKASVDYYFSHLPPGSTDTIPAWDFDYALVAGNENTHRDSSAASISCAAILRVVAALPRSHPDRAGLLARGEAILRDLCRAPYLSQPGDMEASILRKGCYVHPVSPDARGGLGAPDTGQVWGDAYFLDAITTWKALPRVRTITIGSSQAGYAWASDPAGAPPTHTGDTWTLGGLDPTKAHTLTAAPSTSN